MEWLLASHDNGRGPIDPDDATQRERAGLDLRGADLRNVDLSGLPLAQLRAGVFLPAYRDSMDARRATGYTDFESANLTRTQLQRADLANANFDSARLEWAHLEGSDLHQARLTGIRGRWAYFEGADLHAASLRSAALDGAHFQGANLRGASLASTEATSADFADADLQDARFYAAALPQARFERANLRGAEFTDLRSLLIGRARMPADLHETHFEGATLADTQMHSVNLTQAHLEGADLQGARLEAANLSDATFAGADLRRVIFSDLSILERMTLTDAEHGPALLAGVDWNEADLAAVDWAQVPMLGDEALARRPRDANGANKSAQTRLAEYEDAIRAYQQLTVALDTLGLDELAAPYAYRARTLERHLLLRRIFWRGEVWRLGAYLFSAFLALLTGYGYRLQRILIAYVSVVLACAIIFFALGVTGFGGQSVSPTEALLLSITAFHGRVFSAPVALGIAQQWVAAAEAVAGLLIESVFVAMLTQRFFGR